MAGRYAETASGALLCLLAFSVAPLAVLAPLGLAPLLALVGGWGAVLWLIRRPDPAALLRGPGVVVAMLLAWAALSLIWAPEPAVAAGLAGRLALVCIAGAGAVGLARRAGAPVRRLARLCLLAGVVIAVSLLVFILVFYWHTGRLVPKAPPYDPLSAFNGGANLLAMLCWPAAAIAWRDCGRRAGAVLLVAAAGVLLPLLSSGVALVAFAAGGLAAALAWAAPRRMPPVLAALTALGVLLAPSVMPRLFAPEAVDAYVGDTLSPISHRARIWRHASAMIDRHPVRGWGLDAAHAMTKDRVMDGMLELMPLHPHNAAIQIRLELGLPGAALAAVLVFWLVASAARARDRPGAAIHCGVMVGYLTVASSSYGVWQNWWVSTAWMLAAIVGLMRDDAGASPPQ